jgi:hypothetical protein
MRNSVAVATYIRSVRHPSARPMNHAQGAPPGDAERPPLVRGALLPGARGAPPRGAGLLSQGRGTPLPGAIRVFPGAQGGLLVGEGARTQRCPASRRPTPCWGAGPLLLGQGRGSPLPLRRTPPGGAERPSWRCGAHYPGARSALPVGAERLIRGRDSPLTGARTPPRGAERPSQERGTPLPGARNAPLRGAWSPSQGRGAPLLRSDLQTSCLIWPGLSQV